MELPEALKILLMLKNEIEWDFKYGKGKEKYIQAIDTIYEELKELVEISREEIALEIKIERFLKENGYITKKEVEDMIIEHSGTEFE